MALVETEKKHENIQKLNLNLNQQSTVELPMYVHIIVHNCSTQYSADCRTVLIIFPLILQTVVFLSCCLHAALNLKALSGFVCRYIA